MRGGGPPPPPPRERRGGPGQTHRGPSERKGGGRQPDRPRPQPPPPNFAPQRALVSQPAFPSPSHLRRRRRQTPTPAHQQAERAGRGCVAYRRSILANSPPPITVCFRFSRSCAWKYCWCGAIIVEIVLGNGVTGHYCLLCQKKERRAAQPHDNKKRRRATRRPKK